MTQKNVGKSSQATYFHKQKMTLPGRVPVLRFHWTVETRSIVRENKSSRNTANMEKAEIEEGFVNQTSQTNYSRSERLVYSVTFTPKSCVKLRKGKEWTFCMMDVNCCLMLNGLARLYCCTEVTMRTMGAEQLIYRMWTHTHTPPCSL